MLDYFHGRGGWEIVEREDGFASIGAGPERYFDSFRLWPGAERRAMRYVVAPSGKMLLASEPRLEQALSCELDLFSGPACVVVAGDSTFLRRLGG